MKLIHAICLLTLLITSRALSQDVKPNPNLAQILQTLESFNHPESSAISLDGQHLFVTNCASTPDGFPLGAGSISKLEIQPNGTLKMLAPDFAKGLTAPRSE